MQPDQITLLIKKYRAGTASKEEHTAFIEWLHAASYTEAEAVAEAYRMLAEKDAPSFKADPGLTDRIEKAITASEKKAHVFKLTLAWKVAAAAILMVVATGAYLLLTQENSHSDPIAVVAPGRPPEENNNAVLTLADGSSIILDTASNGALVKQGDKHIIKTNALLDYSSPSAPVSAASPILYNTISTPKGGMYQLVLSDGTRVWLNAASSLRFPTSFGSHERKVEVNGEAYFEVASNVRQPFLVTKGATTVEVLGTSFNVNAYDDEGEAVISLLTGSVKVTHRLHSGKSEKVVLTPGKQARILPGVNILEGHINDNEQVIAWKNGRFIFDDNSIRSVMRQIARWYNVEIVYQGMVTDEEFSGIISRSESLSQLLKILERTGAVHFEISGNRVIVMNPQK